MGRRNKMFQAIVVVGASLTGGCDTMAIPTIGPADASMVQKPADMTVLVDASIPVDRSLDDLTGEDLTAPPPDFSKTLPDFSNNNPPPKDLAFSGWGGC
jgi:hypothetical protein